MEPVPVMDRETELAAAVAGRCEAIAGVVGLPRTTGLDFVRNVLDAFPAEGSSPQAERGWRTRAYLLAQAFHCRLPAPGFEDTLRAACNQGSATAVHEALLACPEHHTSRQATANLVILDASRPVMDVTYTAILDFTSGIQRVVRSLAHHLPDVAPGAVLVRWDDHTRGFVPLDAAQAATLACPTPQRPAGTPAEHTLLRSLRRLASWPRRRVEKTFRRRRERKILRQLR
ncbi:MAG: hypothetical protein ACKO1M_02425, partial [Planctomycetota bacterium]